MDSAFFSKAYRGTVWLAFAFALSACGGGGDDPSKPALRVDESGLVTTTLSGSVGDGPIVGGRVTVFDVDGNALVYQASSELALYRVELVAGSADFPLTARVADGIDIVTGDRPSFALETAILAPGGEQVANLNPFGTLAIAIARKMPGGLTSDNLSSSIGIVNSQLGFGVDARGIFNPITVDVTAQNAASLVRSSEALGEAIRRVEAALTTAGQTISAQSVIDAVSADLVDGFLDGAGATGADSRIAAIATIVSAQVMLETMTNRLQVGGAAATGALDSAIQQITGGDLTAPLTGTINTTAAMLDQGRVLLTAAMSIDSSPELVAIRDALAGTQPGLSPGQLLAALPPQSAAALDATIEQAALASPAELTLVNDSVRDASPNDEPVANRLPSIAGNPGTEIMVGDAYSFAPVVLDPDGDALTFSIVNQPMWASFDTATGRLSGTPGAADVRTYFGIQIAVADGFGSVSLAAFDLTVLSRPNHAPVISGAAPDLVTVGNSYEFIPAGEDADGDALSFSIVGSPRWARFDTATGQLSGTPGAGDPGLYSGIQITVSDGKDRTSLAPFSITVSDVPNQAPVIGGIPATLVTVGVQYSFTPGASDPDGGDLVFSIAGKPAWAEFNTATGRLSGIPSDGDQGVYSGIRIRVSDGRDTTALSRFAITVNPRPNASPTISGVPAREVTVDSGYAFMPAASDSDDDDLVFSIAGRPAWASFDAGTGRLSGTPAASAVGTYSNIRISVSDGAMTASLPAFEIIVIAAPNQAPTISGSPATSVNVGASYSFTPSASDPDGGQLTFSIAGRPGWASFSAATGRLTGAPVASDVGTYSNVRISVSDGQETAALTSYTIEVDALPNGVPVISGVPASAVTVGSTYSFTPSASDPDGDELIFSIAGLPEWASFDSATGHLSGVPSGADVGVYNGVQISVSDGEASVSLPTFAIAVNDAPNQLPSISGTPAILVDVDSAYSFEPVANDADGDTLSFSIAGQPLWASFSASTGALTGVPVAGDEGVYSGIRISVSDSKDAVTLPAFSITVVGLPNGVPIIGGSPAATATAGAGYAFTPTASDPDGDNLSFSISGKPSWAGFDQSTGRLSGIPDDGDVGVSSGIRISVSDGVDTASLPAFAITVAARPNRAPEIGGSPATSVTAGAGYSFTPSASDPDGDSLTFVISGKPAWAEFNSGNGRLSGTPGDNDAGVYSGIRISVSDGEDSAALAAFSITVNEAPNQPPTISGLPPTSVVAGSTYTFTPSASDPDGDKLSFSISGKPSWASFDTGNGHLSGAPLAGDTGVYSNIRISVSDGEDAVALAAFTITVEARPNNVPTVGGTPAGEVTVNSAYSFTPSASDSDGDDLRFSISGKPSWADFDTGNGRLFGTPADGDEGVYSGIRIEVSDGEDSATLPAFSITVNGLPNNAPTISGSPVPEVTIGSRYSFTPTASDPDGDWLDFSIAGLPGWADFNSTTGELSGTPLASDEGTYADIQIGVSDGIDQVTLDQFSITVVAQTLGSARLTWDAPTRNSDDTVLDDLAGYYIYYGTAIDDYPNRLDVDDPTMTTWLVENLVPGTWYFVVTAYDTSANESEQSNVAFKEVP